MYKIIKTVLILFLLIGRFSVAEAKINLFETPRYLPAISFYGDSGKSYRLQDFKADLLMAVVWSKNCGPCLNDLKHLNSFAQKTMGSGIQVILISPEKEWRTPDERRLFLQRIGAPNLVSYLDRQAHFADGMGIQATPTAILVNSSGEEVGQITGSVKWDSSDVIDYMLKLKDKTLKQLN